MSGGHFAYKQYELGYIADSIEQTVINNGKRKEYKTGSWESPYYETYSPEVIEKFKEAAYKLREAQIYIHRVDYLICGDDGEENFMIRLDEDLTKLRKEYGRE